MDKCNAKACSVESPEYLRHRVNPPGKLCRFVIISQFCLDNIFLEMKKFVFYL